MTLVSYMYKYWTCENVNNSANASARLSPFELNICSAMEKTRPVHSR